MQIKTLDILVPTRDRPKNMWRLMESIRETASAPKDISISFNIDTDDQKTLDAIPDLKVEYGNSFREVQYLLDERMIGAEAYNRMGLFTNGDLIMYAADDIVFQTEGWDETVKSVFPPDRIALVWCHDPLREAKGEPPFPDHAFISRWGKNVVKYIFPVFPPLPGIPDSIGCCYTDVWLNQLYAHIERRKFLKDVTIEHKHWFAAGGTDAPEFDDNYAMESVLTQWRITPEFVARNKEMPQHGKRLKAWIKYVAEGGLDRVGPEIRKRAEWRAAAIKQKPSDIIGAGDATKIFPDTTDAGHPSPDSGETEQHNEVYEQCVGDSS